ncbi:MAG: hypothetical protein WCO55_02285 [Candidatus Falkowbacteria bacterium]
MRQKNLSLWLVAIVAVLGLATFAAEAAVTPVVKKAVPAIKKAVVLNAAVKKAVVPAKPTVAVKKAAAVPAKQAVAGKKIVAPAKAAPVVKNVTLEQAKSIATDFIKKVLLTDGTAFEVKSIKSNHSVYELEIAIGSSKASSALSLDGKIFYPSSLNIADALAEQAKAPAQPAAAAQTATVVTKNDKPVVELFVMSYCPYGTQIEKGIIPAVLALGDKIDFQLKFVDYAMHGEKELKENITQYCIDKEQHALLLPYVSCFVASESDSAKCLGEAKVDKSKLDACFAATDKQYEITATFAKGQDAWGSSFPPFVVYKADNTKYGVGGSPTLVINGAQVESSRDSQSLLTTICSAFNTKPAECDKTLSSAAPAPGFGGGAAASGTPAANCGTPQ